MREAEPRRRIGRGQKERARLLIDGGQWPSMARIKRLLEEASEERS